ncbi:Alpha/Beta hydrolase protein [Talaromyces proteolyticus]|uniref:Alpha/Beta hydrolase protein n=1 Tax=Talaromyces proteolyticus TaxID=1131652 RepID=A0AAD4KWX3_9EURO|nr:Alpha/Beta hydrolase protein [Talaromyces proteolyticus]KAH8698718.1 Alpha/Beta hydrolase protein [Talaromyces proteolyticus]
MGGAINQTLEQLALNDKLLPSKPSKGPKAVFPTFDPSYREFNEEGMSIIYNEDIPVRDGTKLRGDIFRPLNTTLDGNEKWPIVLAITPFGKQVPSERDQSKTPPSKEFDAGYDGVYMSKFSTFEGSDPAFWTKHGFIYVIVDSRGSFASEGTRTTLVTPVDALDAYDVIEHLGALRWSNGHIGMIGSSALGTIQWFAASLNPPHLSSIIMQDGWTDTYRDIYYKGGIPHLSFVRVLQDVYLSHGNAEKSPVSDLVSAALQHPTFDEFWERLDPDVTKITCPIYVISSFGDRGIHCPGSIRGYLKASAKTKFLELHPYRKWEWQLTPESLERQLAFFHRTLQGPDQHAAKSIDYWPAVRLHTTEKHYAGSWRSENEFPLARTIRSRYYLGNDQQLVTNSGPRFSNGLVTYEAKTGSVFWQYTFGQPTEITGTSRLHLIISISEGSDADLFVTLQKLDRHGNIVFFPYHTYINDGHVSWGWLRASLRKLDPNPTGDEVAPTFRKEDQQPLVPGRSVEVDIGLQPTSTLFRTGETLKVMVQGHDFGEYSPYGPVYRIPRGGTGCNQGQHSISFEGSYLEVPIIPPK